MTLLSTPAKTPTLTKFESKALNKIILIVVMSTELQQTDHRACLGENNFNLSYVYRSAKFGAKFFNFFVRLFILFSVRKVSYIGKR